MTKFNFSSESIHQRELPQLALDVRMATPERNFASHGVAREINALYADTPSNNVIWQPDVYAEARALADHNGIKRIIDVGCGNGEKLIHYFPAEQFETVGLDFHGSLELATGTFPDARWVECDLNSSGDLARVFSELSTGEPVLLILSDVIEHIPDPRLLLAQLRTVLMQHVANRLVVSTPDRLVMDYQTYGTAPDNYAHVREWTYEELAAFCLAAGFQVERYGHTRANQFDDKYSTIYVELRCETSYYLGFLKERGLLHADVLPSHLLVTAEYAGLHATGGIGAFVAAQRMTYGLENTLCLFNGQQDKLDEAAFRRHQLVTPQMLVDEADWPLPLEDLTLKATLQLLFYFPNIGTIEYGDYQGHGCRLAQAKRAGLFPAWVKLVVHCHGATHYLENANQTWYGPGHMGVAEREKISIENADIVFFPTVFLRNLYRESGIEIADEKIVQLRYPYLAEAAEVGKTEKADTLVFFGKRSVMKGFGLCLGALTLGAESLRGFGIKRIVIIGPRVAETQENTGRVEALRQHFEVVELTTLGQTAAIEELRGLADRAVCLMPYLGDNHPYAMLEATFAGILPVMVRAGGVPELYPEPFDRALLADPSEESLLATITALVKMPVEERHRLRVNFLGAMTAAQTEINKAFHTFGFAKATVPPLVKRVQGRATVIVPVFNTELELVSDLIFGLNNQSLSPAEVIFVDDASQPGYASRLDELLKQELRLPYRLISHPKNKGLAGARNTAMNAANTEYVINVDSDDVPLNDFVRNIVRMLDAEPRCGAAVPYLKAFDETTNFNEYSLDRHSYRPLGDGVVASLLANQLGHANSGFRTSVLRELGGWDESEKSMWEDWALYLKLVSSGHRIGIIPQPDCLYRVRKQSMLRTYKTWPAMRRLSRNLAGLPRFDSFRLQAMLRNARNDEQALRDEISRLQQEVYAVQTELCRNGDAGHALRLEFNALTAEYERLNVEHTHLQTRFAALGSEHDRVCAENAAMAAELNRASVRAARSIATRLARIPFLFRAVRSVGALAWKIMRRLRNTVS